MEIYPLFSERFRDFEAPALFHVYFSKALRKGEYAKLACSIICLCLEGNTSSTVKYLYLSILPDDNADVFAASLLLSYCSYSSPISSSVVTSSFYILS